MYPLYAFYNHLQVICFLKSLLQETYLQKRFYFKISTYCAKKGVLIEDGPATDSEIKSYVYLLDQRPSFKFIHKIFILSLIQTNF